MIFQIINLDIDQDEKPHLNAFILEYELFEDGCIWAIELNDLNDLIELSFEFKTVALSSEYYLSNLDKDIIPTIIVREEIFTNNLN